MHSVLKLLSKVTMYIIVNFISIITLIWIYTFSYSQANDLEIPEDMNTTVTNQTATNTLNNDNYCDVGDDESMTSACSYYTTTSHHYYSCLINDIEKSESSRRNIPYSRLDDGVCDCCDGSDETNSNIIVCTNVCLPSSLTDTITSNTTELLIRYHKLSNGLQAKEYLLAEYQSQQSKLMKTYHSYQAKRQAMESLLQQLKIYYNEEIRIETMDRNSLLRERLYHCAIGMVVTS